MCRPRLLFFLLEGTPARRSFAPDVPRALASSAARDGRKSRAGRRQHGRCRTFLCESPTTQSPVLGASMPHVPFLGARKIVFSICVHGLRAYHALNQYRIRYEDMRCKSLVLAPLRLFWVMSSSGFFMRSSTAQFDSVDFNCTTARAALLPITVDLAGHRIKKWAPLGLRPPLE